MKTITVHSGQNIYNLAEQYYGTRSITKLLEDNPQITDMDAVIPAGTQLNIIQFPDNADRVKAFEKAGTTLSTGDNYIAGKWSAPNRLDGLNVSCILIDSTGVVWFASINNGLVSYNGIAFINHSIAMGVTTVNWVIEDESSSKVYAATDIGVLRYDIATSSWDVAYDTGDGLPSNNCRWLGLASDGTFYVGTDTGLATTSDWLIYTNFTVADPELPSNDIRHGHVTGDDTVWLATAAGAVELGIGIYDNASGDLPSDDVLAVWHDGMKIWIATDSAGLVVYDGTNFITHDTAGPNLTSNSPLCFSKDVMGNILIGFNNPLYAHYTCKNGLDWADIQVPNFNEILTDEQVKAIAVDAADNLWIGTKNRAFFYERNNLM